MGAKLVVWMQNYFIWLNVVIFGLSWTYITFISPSLSNGGGMVAFGFHDMLVILSFAFLILSLLSGLLYLKFPWALFLAYGISAISLIASGVLLFQGRQHKVYLILVIICVSLNTVLSVIKTSKVD